MDIVLNTTFDNPNLPIVTLAGFVDTFDRPASDSLGSTKDGKEWDYLGFTPWTVTDHETATGFGASDHALINTGIPDGILTATVARAATADSDKRAGLAFRVSDRQNYLYLCPNTANVLTLYGRFNGNTIISSSINGHTLEDGDEISVAMVGPDITIVRNGATIHSEAVSDLMLETRHGFYGRSASDAEWDSISFTPV